MKKLSYKIIYYLLILLLGFPGVLQAQNEWNLYSNANDIIATEVQGLNLWLGTNGGGLVKFNRTTGAMVFYTKENSDIPGMVVYDVRSDGTSNIWLGTDNGLAYFNGSDWTVYNTDNSDLPSNTVFCVDIDAFGRKWIGTDNGVAVLDGNNWTIYNTGNSGLPSNVVNDIGIKPTGSKWICTNNGLARFDGATWTIYNTGNSPLPSDIVTGVNFLSQGIDVIVGTDAGVAMLLGNNWTVYDTGNSNLPNDNITDITLDNQEGIWVATAGGFAKYFSQNWIPYTSANTEISNEYVNAFAVDADDNIWLGTVDSLNKFNNDTIRAKYFINKTKLESNIINDIKTDEFGTSWFATTVGLASYDGVNWTFYENTRPYQCHNLAFDNNGTLWVATDSGAARFDNGNFTFYNIGNSGIPSDFVTFIVFDVFNKMWIGTDNGLAMYDGNNWTVFNVGNSDLPDNYVTYLKFEGNTHCWIGTTGGLAMYDGIDWTVYTTANSDIPGDFVSSIQITGGGDKWIGILNAGVSFFPDTIFVNFDMNNSPLPSNLVTSLSLDTDGNLWIGTADAGLVYKVDSTWTSYDIDNTPLPTNRVNRLFTDKVGNLWIATELGAAVFKSGGITPSLFITYTDLNVCAGNQLKVVFRNLFAFQNGNQFSIELSDANGNFDNPMVIGTKSSVSANGKDSIICVIPEHLQSGNGFRVRVKASRPVVLSDDNGFDIKIRELPVPEISGKRIVCFDATESYSAPWLHNVTYFWRATNGTIIGDSTKNVVSVHWSNSSPVAYLTLIETNELGCADSLTIEIKIMGHPQMFIIGPKKVCADKKYIYTSDTSHNIRYWSIVGGELINMPAYNKVAVVWTAQEYGTLKLIEVTPGGCVDSVIYAVTIDPTPTADIEGPLEVREGEVRKYYTEPTGSDIDKMWYVINGELIGDNTADTITVKWTKGGLGAVIQSQVNETGCSDSNIVTVRVFETIGMLGRRNVCVDAIELYEANKNLGAYAQWTVTGGEIQGASNARTCYVKWQTPGTGVIKLVQWIPNTSYRDSITVNVKVNEIPPKPTITEHLDTLISSADVGNQWYWNGRIIPGATEKKYYTYQIRGDYTVKVTIANNCESPMSDIFSFVSDVEVQAANEGISIYPNPTSGTFTLNINMEDAKQVNYVIYNILGQKVSEGTIDSGNKMSREIDMQNYPAGVYSILIDVDGVRFNKKFVLTK